jgi:hypothetical protein
MFILFDILVYYNKRSAEILLQSDMNDATKEYAQAEETEVTGQRNMSSCSGENHKASGDNSDTLDDDDTLEPILGNNSL